MAIQWKLKIDGDAFVTSFSESDGGNPIEKVLTILLDLEDPDDLVPFSIRLQKIETDTGEVLKHIKVNLTEVEFVRMTNRLVQLHSIYRMTQQILES